jgi:NAD(P)H dehydrogenase (quinone)
MAKIGIVYYSMYGATYELARAIAEGVEKAGGEVYLRRVPDPLLPDEVKASEGVRDAIEAQEDVPVAEVDELPDFDGIVFGSPTRYGSATSQLQAFLDTTGPHWQSGALVGKAAGFFTGAATMHGGHESTILTMSTFAFHQGMNIVPGGYGIAPEVGSTRSGGSPYGPTQLGDGEGLTEDERQIALAYGQHFAHTAAKLAA